MEKENNKGRKVKEEERKERQELIWSQNTLSMVHV
jgi:hypothetical protein